MSLLEKIKKNVYFFLFLAYNDDFLFFEEGCCLISKMLMHHKISYGT